MTTCIATVEPRAKVAHTALLHECARYFEDDRCWCTIGPRTLGASGSGDVARRTVCTADARAFEPASRMSVISLPVIGSQRDPRKRLRGRSDQTARALWSARPWVPHRLSRRRRVVRLTSRAFRLTYAVHSCVAVDLVQDVPLVLLPRRAHHHVRVTAPSVPSSALQSDPAT